MAQHLTSRTGQWDGDSSFPHRTWMTIIPQRPYGRKKDNKTQESITFKVDGRLGIPARDAIKKIYVGLEGRDNQAFAGKSSVLMLRLEVRSVVVHEVFF